MTNKTTTAGAVVLNQNGLVLLVNQNNDSWSLPKGHVEKGESNLEAAKRETYEESGISQLEFIKNLGDYTRYRIALDGSDDKTELKHIFMFLFKTKQMELCPHDSDNPEARWVEKTKAVEMLTHRRDKKFFKEFLSENSTL